MVLNFIKNTVLIFVVLLFSCGNKSKLEAGSKKLEVAPEKNLEIIVGANQTEKYLPFLNGKKVGVVANQTSVIFIDNNNEIATSLKTPRNDNYTHIVDSLIALNVNITKVFSPEHGFRGKADAGELVSDGQDIETGLPIFSLHGKSKKPSKAQLENVDIMIFDIQDVGVRFYTYISTLHHVMEACAENNIPLLILDRPNPNGHYIDGPTMKETHRSFLGMHPIPLVHGMTIGEYAKMVNGQKWLANGIQCDISIIPAKNYTHQTPYSLPIRPSPNLPNDQSIKLYPSLGLFEGTTINAGRGTELQFQRYGAPFLDDKVFTFSYTPEANFGAKYPKHKGEICYGEDLADNDLKNRVTLKWLIKAYNNSNDKQAVFNTDSFTKHSGTAKLQQQIIEGMSEADIIATWQDDLETYKEMRKQYLIYN